MISFKINRLFIQRWLKNGQRHRTDGPAVILKSSARWYKNGLLHRDDGPCIIHADGNKSRY